MVTVVSDSFDIPPTETRLDQLPNQVLRGMARDGNTDARVLLGRRLVRPGWVRRLGGGR